jgi:hypothetical protein
LIFYLLVGSCAALSQVCLNPHSIIILPAHFSL